MVYPCAVCEGSCDVMGLVSIEQGIGITVNTLVGQGMIVKMPTEIQKIRLPAREFPAVKSVPSKT